MDTDKVTTIFNSFSLIAGSLVFMMLLFLGILLPFFVYRINVYTKKTWKEAERQTDLLRKIAKLPDSF